MVRNQDTPCPIQQCVWENLGEPGVIVAVDRRGLSPIGVQRVVHPLAHGWQRLLEFADERYWNSILR
jgi:hypothetical protein